MKMKFNIDEYMEASKLPSRPGHSPDHLQASST